MPPVPTRPARGFTLVELLIVVVLLGILASIAIPSMRSDRKDTVSAVLRGNLTQVQMVLEVQRQQTPDGGFPPALEPAWFVAGILPPHPDNLAGVPAVETVGATAATHPADKVLQTGSPGAYWYNTSNGAFRARVKAQPTPAETLAFYNEVNGCELAALGDVAATADSIAKP